MARLRQPSKAAQERVLRIARSNRRLEPLLARAPAFVEPSFADRKAGEGDRAVVAVHDAERSRSLVAVVDAKRNRVVGVEETPVQFQLNPNEREEAERLARADERVRRFLRGRQPRPLTRLYFPPEAEEGHRYAVVFVRPSNAARRYAVVDLTEGAVVDVLRPADLAG